MIPESERRKYPRADLIFDLTYSIGEQGPVATFSRDISLGGVSFQTREEFELDTVLNLTFTMGVLPEGVTASGKVVRSWKDGAATYTAVEFTDIDGTDLMIILDYINSTLGKNEQ